MSRFVLILLIALLPLRGWSAERMAVQMAASEVAVQAMAADGALQAMPDDCPMRSQAAAAEPGAAHGEGESKSAQSCQTCQLCMSLAAVEVPIAPPVVTEPLHIAVPPADRFVSAELTRAAKPPIS